MPDPEQLCAALAQERDPAKRYELQRQLDELLWCDDCGSPHDETEGCDTGLEDDGLTDEEWEESVAAENAELDQRFAAEHEQSIFGRGTTPAEQQEMEELAAGRYPKRSVNHVRPFRRATPDMRRMVAARRDPGVRRKPTRTGRTYRPGVRRTPRATRAGPQSDDDPEPEPLARPAAMVATAGAGILAFTRTRRDALVLARVVMLACRAYGEPRRG